MLEEIASTRFRLFTVLGKKRPQYWGGGGFFGSKVVLESGDEQFFEVDRAVAGLGSKLSLS